MVVGVWSASPFGAFADVMVQTPDDDRILLAPDERIADFVLHRPRKDEQSLIEESIDKALHIIPLAVEGKFDTATMRLHTA